MTEENQLTPMGNPNDKLSIGLAILSFCIPLAGAIIYFPAKTQRPKKQNLHAMQLYEVLGLPLLVILLVVF